MVVPGQPRCVPRRRRGPVQWNRGIAACSGTLAGRGRIATTTRRSAVDLAGLLPSSAHEERRAVDRNAVTAAVVTLLERADHPVCWVLDDLQWMDGATRDLAAYLAKVTVEGPLLLIGTVRTDPAEPSRLPDGLDELARACR